jgi:hypothetical protein
MKIFLARHAQIITFLLITTLLFLRDQNAFLHPMFWAEDGILFFQQNNILGWHAIFTSFAGYLDFIIRIIAIIAGYFPFNWQPALYNYAAFAVMLFVVNRIFSNRIHLPLITKTFFSLSLVLVPSNGEPFMILTNVQFVTSILLILLLIQSPPITTRDYVGDLLVALFVGLSGPISVLLMPLFLWKHYKEKSIYSRQLLLVILGVVCIQLYFLLHTNNLRMVSPYPATSLDWLRYFGPRMWSIMFGIVNAKLNYSVRDCFIAAILFWMILPYCLYARSRVTFFLFAVVVIIECVSVFRMGAITINLNNFITGSRYDYVPAVMIAWLLLLSLSGTKSLVKKGFVIILLSLMLHNSLTHYDYLRKKIINWSQYYAQAKTASTFTIPINPDWKLNCSNYSCDNEKRGQLF